MHSHPLPLNFTVQGYADSGTLGTIFLLPAFFYHLFTQRYSAALACEQRMFVYAPPAKPYSRHARITMPTSSDASTSPGSSTSRAEPTDTSLERADIRRVARQVRRGLNQAQQHRAALKLLLRLGDHPLLRKSERCAFYIPNDGEISPLLLMFRALQLGKRCYLPRLKPGKRLAFHLFSPGDTLRPNAFGIPEPSPASEIIPAADLDVVFLPLVAFDAKGNRLGMGGGYYDRSFSFKHAHHRGPKLVGLAHHSQQTSALPSQAWDVPLNFIATDQNLLNARR